MVNDMAMKTICDRCGAVIEPSTSVTCMELFDRPHQNVERYVELCVSCAFHLREWLDGGKDNG